MGGVLITQHLLPQQPIPTHCYLCHGNTQGFVLQINNDSDKFPGNFYEIPVCTFCARTFALGRLAGPIPDPKATPELSPPDWDPTGPWRIT